MCVFGCFKSADSWSIVYAKGFIMQNLAWRLEVPSYPLLLYIHFTFYNLHFRCSGSENL